jgi:glycosyltransferase involved in cell wall biosynthesis
LGGVETYLSDIIPALRQAGHALAIACECEPQSGAESIMRDAGDIEIFSAARLSSRGVVEAVKQWRPDLVYAHGLDDPWLEHALTRLAPTVFFIHNYHGTCISGTKCYTFPVLRPCTAKFGVGCMVHYYPRRCGGLSPVTMIRQFVKQGRRLRIVRQCAAVVTHSFHMYSEFARHGVPLDRLHRFVYYSAADARADSDPAALLVIQGANHASADPALRASDPLVRITVVGRLDLQKGAHLLIDAAPVVARKLGRQVRVIIVGDGPMRQKLQRRAARTHSLHAAVEFEFTGWLKRDQVGQRLRQTHVVAFPSAWPEPFGLVGPEAGKLGIPVAAFAVGGVRGWLVDSVNGFLAPGDPPTPQGLAAALVSCLRDEQTYDRLRRGAVEMAARFSRGDHLGELLAIFERVVALDRVHK